MKTSFYVILFLLFSNIIHSQISYVNGNVSGQNWTTGTYYVMADINVEDGFTLTIGPGVVVKFANNTGLIVHGTLDVNGTSANNVKFTSTNDNTLGAFITGSNGNPQPGNWNGIYLDGYLSYQGIGEFDWCNIRYGGYTWGGVGTNVYFHYSDNGHFTNSISEFSSHEGLKTFECSPELSYCTFSNNNEYGVYCGNYSGTITQNLFSDNGDNGLFITGNSTPTITNNTFNNNDGYAAFLNNLYLTSLPGNTGIGNTFNAIALSGTVNSSFEFTNLINLPYVAHGDITVNETKTLTFEAGTIMKFDGIQSGLIVKGTIDINGTNLNQVIFTSIKDDNFGGDTNGDSTNTSAASGDWDGIYLNGYLTYQGIGEFDWCTIRYGGYQFGDAKSNVNFHYSDSGHFINSISEYSTEEALKTTQCSPPINNSTFGNSNNYGIYCNTYNGTITQNIFSGNGNDGLYIIGDCTPTITYNTFNNNDGHGAYLQNIHLTSMPGNTGNANTYNAIAMCGTVDTSFTLTNLVNLPYVVFDDITVHTDDTLIIEAGTIMKFNGIHTDLIVLGKIDVNGTNGNPVTFTSINDDNFGGDTNADGNSTSPDPGNWGGIYLNGYLTYQGIGEFDWCNIRYGGYQFGDTKSNVNFHYSDTGHFINSISEYSFKEALKISNCSPSINNSTFSYSNDYGVYCDIYDGTITQNIFSNNGDDGLYIMGNCTPTITYNTFNNNDGYGAYLNNIHLTSMPGNTGAANTFNAIALSGTVDTSFTLTNLAGLTYVAHSNIYVTYDNTLTFEAGTVMKFVGSNTGIDVTGKIVVNGTGLNPVVFTSINDDTFGGDSNGNNNATSAAPGDWDGIYIHGYLSNQGIGEFDWCTIRYGGYQFGDASSNVKFYYSDSSHFINSKSEYSFSAAIKCNMCSPEITNNTINNNNNEGIYLTNSSSVIRGNTINDNLGYGIYISGSDSIPNLGNNDVSDKGLNTFQNNDNGIYHVYNATINDINAYYNNWGYSIADSIDTHIYDDNELSSFGEVLFNPWYINEVLAANFEANITSGVSPLNVTFTDLSTGNPTSWTWYFGDGQSSTDQNPTNVYQNPGIYTVSLDISNSVGTDSHSITNYIEVTAIPTYTNELFFSEYIEGTVNNKAFEIFNSGSTIESLSNYLIIKSVNGGGWSQIHTFPINSSIAPGDVWVIAADQASLAILNIADEQLTYPSIVHYNGDDAIGLMKITGSDTLLVDVIGIPDVDPGYAWQVSIFPDATKEHTLIRKSTITSGNIDWSISAGTNDFNSEWIVLPQDEFQFLGTHPDSIPVEVTFNVNMSYQISQGNFDPALDYVDLAGSFNNWGSTQLILDDLNSDSIYSATLTGYNIGDTIECKARINGDWNTSELYGLPNRAYMLTLQYDFIDFWYNDEESSNLISINQIQSTLDSLDISSYANDIVSTSGIVTAIQGVGYYIQDGFGAWNGIFIYDQINTPAIGDLIEITGQVLEYNSLTEFNYLTSFSIISSGNTLPDPIIISSFVMSNTEAYEGVLVEVQNAICIDTLNNFGQWRINDGSGQCVVDDAIFWFNPSLGNTYNVTGVVGYNFGEFRLYPRDLNDIINYNTSSQVTINVNMSYQISQGNFNPALDYVDLAGTFNNWGSTQFILDDLNGDSIYSITITGFNIGDTIEFKSRINGDWNTSELFGLSNRVHVITQTTETLDFWYNDEQSINLISIYSIQSSIDTIGNSTFNGQTVTTSGIVTAFNNSGYYIQDGNGQWSGIYVYDSNNTVSLGDEIQLTAEVYEYFDFTELKTLSSFSILSSGNTIPAATIISATSASTDEAYESVLVQVQNTNCIDTLNNYGEWIVNDGSLNLIINDEIFWFSPTLGNTYNITGVIKYNFGEFKLNPRNINDILDVSLLNLLDANLNTLAAYNDYYSTGIQNLFPHFCFANTGILAINSYEISFNIDNNTTQTVYQYNQSLQTGDSFDFDYDFFINYSNPGIHTITAWITGVNGQYITVGDTLTDNFEVISISNPVYSYMSYPIRQFTMFDISSPDKLIIINNNPMPFDNVLSATWYNNQYLGIKNGSDELVVFDQYHGNYTVIGSLGIDLRSISYDNNADILFGLMQDGSVYQIDPVTAIPTLIYQGSASGFKSMACDISGNLFGLNYDDDNLYSINPITGIASIIGYIGYDAYYTQGMEFDLNTGILYVTSFTNPPANCDLRTVNPLTGASTIIGTFAGGYQMVGLAIPYNNQSYTQSGDYSLSLDGVDEYIEVWGDLPAQSNDFTYEAWIYPTDLSTIQEIIYWNDGIYDVQFRINQGGSILYGESGNGTWKYVTSNSILDSAEWTHIAVTKSGDICTLFLNGIPSGSDTINLNPSPTSMTIGSRDWPNDRFFNGKIDDIRIWNEARTEAEIGNSMCSSSITDSTLLNRWQFSEGPGAIHAYDEIQNRVSLLNNMEYMASVDCDWKEHICNIVTLDSIDANLNNLTIYSDYYETGIQNLLPNFSFVNTGIQTINSFEISFNIDNNTQTIYQYNQALQTGDSFDFDYDLFINYSNPGIHTITAWITGINGQYITVGDTLTDNFEVISISNPVYSYMSYPIRQFTMFDISSPDKLIIINNNPMPFDNVVSATWYNNQYIGIKNGSDELVVFDHYLGTYSIIGPFGADIRSITYDNTNDILFGMDPLGSLYHIDPTTAATTLIYQGSGSEFKNLACDLSGNLFAVSYTDDNLYSINPTTGIATIIGYIGFDAFYSSGMSFDLNTGQLYMTAFTAPPDNCDLRTINPLTGASTIIGTFAGGYQMVGLAIPYNNQSSTQTGDYAISLDGVDEYIEVWGNLPAQENDFTYEAWIYPNETNYFAEIIHWHDGVYGIQFRINPDGTLLYGESGNGSWQYVISTSTIDTSTWTHVAVTKEGDICSLFINGNYQVSDTVNLNITPNSMMFGGRGWANDRFFNGKIDDVRIWDEAREEAEIGNSMCSSSITNSSLLHRWQFSEGPGSLHAYDEIENRVSILNNMEYLAGVDCDWVTNICGTSGTILTADFIADVVTGVAPLSVSFTDLSLGSITNWSWDFGDGGAGLSQNPTWTYQTPGLYTVSLTVYDSNGSNTLVLYDLIEVTSPQTNSPNWTIVNTGVSHTVLIQSSAPVTIDGIQIATGDYIGAFYDSLGTPACAGFEAWTGSNLAITVWGDDSQSIEPDGFAANETFTWKIWRASDDTEFIASADYMQPPIMPNTGFYAANGMSGLISLTATTVDYQYINLPQGWSYFSTYIDPFEPNIDSLCAPFVSDVIIGKDGNGNTYWPQWGINNIGDLIIGDGYQIKLANPHYMEVEGISLIPENTPIIIPQGWSMLAYLRQNSAPIDQIFSSFVTEVIIIKNTAGQTFWPQWSINMIGNMNTGEGYLIKLNSQQTLTYPANSVIYTKEEVINRKPIKLTGILNTGSNMTLGIPLSAWEYIPEIGDEIGVFSSNRNLVGSAVFTGQNMAITIWGDDELTPKIEGSIIDEEFIVKLWNHNDNNEYEIIIYSWIEGDNLYYDNKISLAGKLSVTSNDAFVLHQNTPNPFKEQTEFKFYLPQDSYIEFTVLNILGDVIEILTSDNYVKGEHSLIFNSHDLSEGTYFYRLKTNEFTETKKMIVISR